MCVNDIWEVRYVNKKYSKRGISIIVVIVLLIVALIAVKTNSMRRELDKKESELASIEQKIEKAEEETDKINNEIIYRQTDEYIEDRAREDLGLRYEDEIILVPKEE